jgi:hypothetical protein
MLKIALMSPSYQLPIIEHICHYNSQSHSVLDKQLIIYYHYSPLATYHSVALLRSDKWLDSMLPITYGAHKSQAQHSRCTKPNALAPTIKLETKRKHTTTSTTAPSSRFHGVARLVCTTYMHSHLHILTPIHSKGTQTF